MALETPRAHQIVDNWRRFYPKETAALTEEQLHEVGKRRRGPRGRSNLPVSRQGDELQPGVGTGDTGERQPAGSLTPKSNSVGNTAHEHDYRIPDNRIITGTPESRARANLDAIAIMKQVQGENRPATQEEKEILARYVGWGAIKPLFAGPTPNGRRSGQLRQALTEQEYDDAERSVANAHYTGDWHIDAIWKALQTWAPVPVAPCGPVAPVAPPSPPARAR